MEAPLEAPAEPSVRNQGHTGSKSHACNGGSGIQHLSHSWAAFWPLIADDYYIPGLYLSSQDRRNSVLLAFKDTGRSFMYHHLRHYSRPLYNAGIRRQISFQNCQAACLAVRIVNGPDYLRIQILASFLYFLLLSFRLQSYSPDSEDSFS